jgi:hypothetical protein
MQQDRWFKKYGPVIGWVGIIAPDIRQDLNNDMPNGESQ